MTRRFVILAEAEAQISEAALWYEQRNKASANRFVSAFRSALGKIIHNPLLYQPIDNEIRRAPVAGFPYGLLYAVSGEEIIVLSCFHGRRNPERWRERLK
jgi:plasmid stabilization system protein ParE